MCRPIKRHLYRVFFNVIEIMQKQQIHFFLTIGLTVAVAFLVYLQFSGNSKMVYIDSNKLLGNYQGMKDAQVEFQKKNTLWQANVDTLMVEVQRSIMDYEKTSAKMSKKEKELSRELIRTKQKQLGDYQAATREQSAQEDQQMTQQVLVKVNTFMTEYGKRKGYKVIFGATTAGNIIYAEDAMDITDEVLELLNAQYQKI